MIPFTVAGEGNLGALRLVRGGWKANSRSAAPALGSRTSLAGAKRNLRHHAVECSPVKLCWGGESQTWHN